jgi:hypothetical protein
MVISYPTAAGGNRFAYYLAGLNYIRPGIYDSGHHDPKVGNIINLNELKYLNDDYKKMPTISQESKILTHTLNNKLIHQIFPEHTIYNINIDLKSALRRGVSLFENTKFENLLDYYYTVIVLENNYYKKYPPDYTNGIIVSEGHEFFKFMTNYLATFKNPLFDLAWNIYEKYGETIEIMYVWNEIKTVYEKYGDITPIIEIWNNTK